MKETSLGWAPAIPSHWEVVPLSAVARMGTGHTPDRNKSEYWENCTIPWVTTPDVTKRRRTLAPLMDTEQKISELGLANSAAVLHPANTIMLSRTASVGYSVRIGRPMATTQAFVTWNTGPRLEPRYLLLVLRAMEQEWERLAYGSTHLTIYMPDLESLRIPLPPLEEQRRIADCLDAETARIDRVVSLRQRQLAVFEERKQAVADHFLVQERDPKVRLARLCRVQSGVTVNGGRFSEDAELRPYLRVANVQANGLDLSEVKEILVDPTSARRFELRPGDVLMTEGGDLDKLGRGTVWSGEIPGCLHQNHVFAVRPNSRLSGEYLALLTRTSLARSYFEMTGSKTTNLASTSSGKILAFRVPLLDLDEQLRRTKVTKKELSRITAIATSMAKQVELLQERRQALITAAVTGEFDVSAASGRGIEE